MQQSWTFRYPSFNCDESAFPFDPKPGTLIGVETADKKSQITTVLAYYLPDVAPMIIFDRKRLKTEKLMGHYMECLRVGGLMQNYLSFGS